MGYTVLFRVRSKCVCCIYIYIYIYMPSMYKSLKVKYVHKHTTLGFDKSPDTKFLSRLLRSTAVLSEANKVNPFLITPEDDVICGHHVLGYGQWYYILG